MSIGTSDFIGERLRDAREARGMDVSELAVLVEVARSAITQFEQGQTTPQSKELTQLAHALHVPELFFLKKKPDATGDTLFHRSLSNVPKVSRKKAERKYEWLKEITAYLRGFVGFPPTNLPHLSLPTDLYSIDANVIEDAATQTRRHWGLGDGPISDVTLLLENNGVFVSKSTFETPKMEGYSGIDGHSRTAYTMIDYNKGSAVGSRHDLAHELAHLVLHQRLPSPVVGKPKNNRMIERQAHDFAGAFLLPERALAAELPTVTPDKLRTLKRHWRVSTEAMLHRMGNLGWISEQESKRLWISLCRRGWRTNEPLEDPGEPERPRLLRRAFELLIKNHVREPAEIMLELRFSKADICELAGVSPELLARDNSKPMVARTDAGQEDIGSMDDYVIDRKIIENRN